MLDDRNSLFEALSRPDSSITEGTVQCVREASGYSKEEPDSSAMHSNVNEHLLYLSEAVRSGEVELFTEYMHWAQSLEAEGGYSQHYLETVLQCLQKVLGYHLPESQARFVDPFLDAAVAALYDDTTPPASYISAKSPLAEQAQTYLDALLAGKRHDALQLIQTMARGGAPVQDIYLDVFQSVQYEIGRLWQLNQISVAQEHFCTAVTQMAMAQLYPYIFATRRVGRTLVASCVGGELHELGPRMVADFFEMAGWDTYYLGANTPSASVIQTVLDQRADVVGISVTMTYYVHKAQDLIAALRDELGDSVRILVGGYPFVVSTTLARDIGADGSAQNAQDAVQLAEHLVAS